ncbi:MAG: winged helix-turn-helix transcriptional regulator [Lysobacteraceae bacterium]
MKGYGQFCPLAIASELLGERWTPLVLRELMLGATRFNEIHRGVPRMSPSLLSKRLQTLQRSGLIQRRRVDGRHAYTLSEAGRALKPVVEQLAVWSKRWLPATLSDGRDDPDLVMWDMHRRMHLDRLPERRTVMRFEFSDQPTAKQLRWIVGNRTGVELCITDPGLEVDLFVLTTSQVITLVWYGDLPLERSLREGLVKLHGHGRLCRAFPSWLQLSLIAGAPREQPLAIPGH